MLRWLSLIGGGAIGTVARYSVSKVLHENYTSTFPIGTLVVNLTGCFVIGFLAALSEDKTWFSYEMKLFLISGFCGAFTTFSTFMFETSSLLKTGDLLRATSYMMASMVVGFLFFRAGVFLGKIV